MTRKVRGNAKTSRYDLDFVRQAASSRWPEVLSHVAGVDVDILDGQHHPCPKCGGTDRFRAFTDGSGGAICNQCFRSKNGSGFSVVGWMCGCDFPESLKLVAEYLNIPAESNPLKGRKAKPHKADPAEKLTFLPWSDTLAALWCLTKPPVTIDALNRCHARMARYRDQYTVIAIPVWGESLTAADPVGWVLYNITGGELPKFAKDEATGKWFVSEWVKVKVTFGSHPGVIGDVQRIPDCTCLWKLEGPSDVLAWYSLPPVDGHLAITNANGAGEIPSPWMISLFAGKVKPVLHDADKPGQDGAIGHEQQGKHRPGWCEYLNTGDGESLNVLLPYPIADNHGKDFRDWCNEGNTDLLELLGSAEPVSSSADAEDEDAVLIEEDDDPHRLARVNLERYQVRSGGTIRYWNGSWLTWKPSRGSYKTILAEELRAKVTASIRGDFERIWRTKIVDYRERQRAGETEEGEQPPTVRKVSNRVINDTINALASLCVVPKDLEFGMWFDGTVRERRNYMSLQNGLLDIDALLADKSAGECLLPHSPDWFSTTTLPYAYDLTAKCPRWLKFIDKSMGGDERFCKILQEWAGYCLIPDLSKQMFLANHGNGSNGKSVFAAGLTALLGHQNVSNVPLDRFGDRFEKTSTLGKLLNIDPDADADIAKPVVGALKSFTAGDRMFFDRKGMSGLNCAPTAKLMINFNSMPQLKDPSDGVWRRIVYVPWSVTVAKADRIDGMDSHEFWEQSGECPGILNWAILGLARLRSQGTFTESPRSAELLGEHRNEMSDVRRFAVENMRTIDPNKPQDEDIEGIYCKQAYWFFRHWAEHEGIRYPVASHIFGRQLKQAIRFEKKRAGRPVVAADGASPEDAEAAEGKDALRPTYYSGIRFLVPKIYGEDVYTAMVRKSSQESEFEAQA